MERYSQKRLGFVFTALLIVFVGSYSYMLQTQSTLVKQLNVNSASEKETVDNRIGGPINHPQWNTMNLSKMTNQQLLDYFRWGNRSSCLLFHDFGGNFREGDINGISGLDGQKAVCILPNSVAIPYKNCTVYSFGINYEWSFDEAMELYGCQVYAFDPSMEDVDDKFDKSPAIHFYKLGLGPKDGVISSIEWKMKTLSTIYKTLGHKSANKTIDYLKMDIEEAEWPVLRQIMESGMLSKVRQMGIEIHLCENGMPILSNTKKLRESAEILRSLEEKYGMIRFDSKINPWCNHCFEIAWYNSKFVI